jgi:antitoxin HigA-1
MPMKNPPHIGGVIWHGIFEPLGLSITKAAEVLGVRRATYPIWSTARRR